MLSGTSALAMLALTASASMPCAVANSSELGCLVPAITSCMYSGSTFCASALASSDTVPVAAVTLAASDTVPVAPVTPASSALVLSVAVSASIIVVLIFAGVGAVVAVPALVVAVAAAPASPVPSAIN